MTKRKERFGGMIINWTSIAVQIVISLFFIPFFLNTVGDKQYGLHSFSTSIITWLDVLVVAVGSAYYKFLTREKKNYGEAGEARACGVFFNMFIVLAALVLVVGLAFDVLLYFEIIPLSQYTSSEKNQICIIILMSIISAVVSCSLSARKSYHYYKQKYILLYSLSLWQILVQTLLSVIFLKNGYGVIAVAGAHFGASIVISVTLGILSKVLLKEKIAVRPLSEEDKKYRKKLFVEILIFSSFVIMNTVVDAMNKTLDKTILGFYNADSIANYQLAYTIPAYLISFTSIISIVFDQKMNEAYYNGRGVEELNEIFLKVSKFQTIFTMLIVGGFIACGKEFVFLWLDDTREQVYIISCIFMLTYSITCSNRLAIAGRRVQNYHIKSSFIYVGIAAFNIVLSVILVCAVPRENAIWACVTGTVVTYIIGHWIIMQIYDTKITKLDIWKFFKTFLKYLFIALTIDLVIMRFIDIVNIHSTILAFVLKGCLFAIIYIVTTLFVERDDASKFLSLAKHSIQSKFKRKIKNTD